MLLRSLAIKAAIKLLGHLKLLQLMKLGFRTLICLKIFTECMVESVVDEVGPYSQIWGMKRRHIKPKGKRNTSTWIYKSGPRNLVGAVSYCSFSLWVGGIDNNFVQGVPSCFTSLSSACLINLLLGGGCMESERGHWDVGYKGYSNRSCGSGSSKTRSAELWEFNHRKRRLKGFNPGIDLLSFERTT